MRVPRLSPGAYRRVTLGALVALGFIVVTGAAVRLTGSGLGCPDWPTCDEGRVFAPVEYHAMVEFVNRTITGLVSVAVILAVLGSLVRRPRRADLVKLSLGLVAGVVGQIVLGGLTVLFHLKPQFVMAHFLLSMVLLANAVALHERAGDGADARGPTAGAGGDAAASARSWVAGVDLLRIGRLTVVAAALVIFLGTIVTSSGPHGGDETAERFSLAVRDVARLHGVSVVLYLGLVVVLLWRLWAARAPAALLRRGEVVLAVAVVQGAIGYAQYFAGVPALLVGFHVAGATATWIATVRLWLALARYRPAPVAVRSAPAQPMEVVRPVRSSEALT